MLNYFLIYEIGRTFLPNHLIPLLFLPLFMWHLMIFFSILCSGHDVEKVGSVPDSLSQLTSIPLKKK